MNIRKNTLWNLLGSAVPMLIGVAAIPYIYNAIGIERIGVLTMVWALIGYFSIFDFGMGRAITQRIASFSSNDAETQKTLTATTGVYLTLALGIIGGLLGIAAIEIAGLDWMNFDESLQQEIYASFFLACLAVPATTTTAGLRGILEGEQRFETINVLKLALGLSNFLSPVVSILLFGARLDYIVLSLVLTRYIILFLHYFVVKSYIANYKTSFSHEETKNLVKFGSWMTLSNIISPLMVVADRFLIASTLGAAVVAYYTVPAEFMLRLLILPAAITTTLFPVFSKNLSENKHADSLILYKKTLAFIFFMMAAIAIVIIISANTGITLWLGSEFARESSAVASVLAIGIIFNSMAQVPHAYIQASGDARSTAFIHLFESILYIPLLFLFMQLYGIIGAAFAWALRALIDLILLHIRAMRING